MGSDREEIVSDELVSKSQAIEALEKTVLGGGVVEHGCFSPDWREGVRHAIKEISCVPALPVVPTDSDLVSELHECLAMHHTAAYDLRQDIIEILTHFPVPLVPQSDETSKKGEDNAG
jgi:hypothetical protein